MKEYLSADEQKQVDIVSLELPKDRKIKRILFYSTLATIFALVGALFYYSQMPRYESSPEVADLSEVYEKYAQLDKMLTFSSYHDYERYHHGEVITEIEELDSIFQEKIANRWPQYDSFYKRWRNFKSQLINELPEAELVHRLAYFESRLSLDLEQFIALLDQFVEDLVAKRTITIETIREAEGLLVNAHKISGSLNRLLSANFSAKTDALARLTEEINALQSGIIALYEGVPVKGVQSLQGMLEEEQLNEVEYVFSALSEDLNDIVINIPQIVQFQSAFRELRPQMQLIGEEFRSNLLTARAEEQKRADFIEYANLIFAGIIILMLILLVLVYFVLRRRVTLLQFNVRSEQEQNRYHEAAIFNLINQVEYLAKGDLSMELTVTDDSTGVIADSINVAVERIRTIIEEATRAKEGVLQFARENRTQLERIREEQKQIRLFQESIVSSIDEVTSQLNLGAKYLQGAKLVESEALPKVVEASRGTVHTAQEKLLLAKRSMARLAVELHEIFTDIEAIAGSQEEIKLSIDALDEALSLFTIKGSEESDLRFDLSDIRKNS